jgi:hypothetical protein
MKKLLLGLSTILLISTFPVLADTGPYLEVNGGYSTSSPTNINQDTFSLSEKDNQYLGWNVNAGVMFLGVGIDAGYTQYGNIAYQLNHQETSTDLYSTHFAFKLSQSLGPIFFSGKLGWAELNQGGFTLNQVNIPKQSGSGFYWSLGGGIKFTPVLYAQLQYEQVQGNNNLPTVGMTMLGLGYTFSFL